LWKNYLNFLKDVPMIYVNLIVIFTLDQLDAQILVLEQVYYILLHVSSTVVLETCRGI